MAALAGVAVLNGVIMISLWWAAARMVRYLVAIFRLREDSSPEEAEEVLLRQRRLWIALVFATSGYLLSTAITAPVSIGEAADSAAEKQAWDEQMRKIREE